MEGNYCNLEDIGGCSEKDMILFAVDRLEGSTEWKPVHVDEIPADYNHH